MKKKRLLLIDGDIYAYLHAAAAEKAYDWGDGQWTLYADEITAWTNMKGEIDSFMDLLEADRLIICLSSSSSWRKEKIYPEYKSNRDGVRRPMILKALKEHMLRCYEALQFDWLEADDVMGIIATDPEAYPDYDKIIVSQDKDLKTVPGVVWDGKLDLKDKPILTHTDKDEAYYRFMLQTLTGDTADGYPGCPGYGPKTAEKLLAQPWNWSTIVSAFEKKGLTEQDALTQARCARILQVGEYDFDKKEPKLWLPTV